MIDSKTKAVFRRIVELLEPRSSRTSLRFARDDSGAPLDDPSDPRACQWCLYGALWKASNDVGVGMPLCALKEAIGLRGPLTGLWDTSEPGRQDLILAGIAEAAE